MFYKKLKINGTEYPLAVNITGVGAPTSATEASVGMFYMDETNGEVYKRTPEGWVQETFVFANALRGNASGTVVSIDDMTPLPTKVQTKVESKNLISIAEKTVSSSSSWSSSVAGDIKVKSGMFYTASADFVQTGEDLSIVQLSIRRGSDLTKEITATQSSNQSGKLWVAFKVPNDEDKISIVLYSNLSATVLNTSCTFSNIQIEEGSTATAFTPYIADGTAVTVKSCGKNIFNIQDIDSTEDSGDCYTYNYWLKPNTKYTVSSNAPNTMPMNIYANGDSTDVNGVSVGVPRTVITDSNGYMYISVRFKPASNGGIDLYSKLLDGTYYLQIEEGEVATAYEPYTEGETITTAIGETVELAPIAPNMTITSDTAGALLSAEYNKDTNKVVEKLVQAIISLGGTV